MNILEHAEITDMTKKLTIDGVTSAYTVYKIPVELLKYNFKNDRISTEIMEYQSKHKNIEDLSTYDLNIIVEELIEKSDVSALKKTKANIKSFSQREAGVVLKDGTVIDGNRRLTCIRQLNRDSDMREFKYFEGVVLTDLDYSNAKVIKSLELQIQHGFEEKVGYNPINRLAGIYKYIIKDQLFTAQEYADHTNMKLRDLNRLIDQVHIIISFLDYIGMPEAFYVAKQLDLDGPSGEIANFVRSINRTNLNKYKRHLEVLFAYMIAKPSGDLTRYIRKLISKRNIIDFVQNPNIMNEFQIYETEIHNVFEEKSGLLGVETLRNQRVLINDMDQLYNVFFTDKEMKNEKHKEIRSLEKAYDELLSIDKDLLKASYHSKEKEIKTLLAHLKGLIQDLEQI
jgi:hypothetical protein